MKNYVLSLLLLLSASTVFAQTNPREFNFSGQLTDGSGNPLTPASVTFTLKIFSPSNCLLYQEEQILNLSSSNGKFSIGVGSAVGAVKRTAGTDPGNAMTAVFRNSGTIPGNSCTYNPAVGDQRSLVVTVDDGVTTETLSAQVIRSVPVAFLAENAEAVGGYAAADLVKVNTTSPQVLSQSNLENVFTTSNYSALTSLLAGTSALYNKPASNGTNVLPSVTSPTTPTAGQIWYNAGNVYYHDGSTTRTVSTGSSSSVSAASGTAGAPSISFSSDSDSGWYSAGADNLAAATGGVERVRINENGNLGIGTTSPTARLSLGGNPTAAAWTSGGIGIRQNSSTYTDSSSSGTVGFNYVNAFGIPTLAASSATTYTNASALALYPPVAGTNVTLTNSTALTVNSGALTGVTNGYGLQVNAPTAATNNYAATFMGGNVGVGVSAPSAKLHLAAGTTAAGTASLKIAQGVLNTTPESGAIEYDGTSLYYTDNTSTRRSLGGSDSFATLLGVCANGYTPVKTAGAWTCIEATDLLVNSSLVKRNATGNFTANTATLTGLKINNAGSEVTIASPIGGNYSLVLPVDDGLANQVLRTDGSGVLSWSTPATGDFMRDGSVTMTGSLRAADGTAALPSMTFASDTNTGVFRAAADVLGFSTNATEKMRIDSTGNVGVGTTSPAYKLDVNGAVNATSLKINGVDIASGSGDFMRDGSQTMTGALRATAGAVGTPSLTFSGDTDTGIYQAGSDIVAVSTAGVKRLEVDATGSTQAISSLSASSGSAYGLKVNPVVSTTGTATFTGLLVDATGTSAGGSNDSLLDLQRDSSSVFKVSQYGTVTVAGSIVNNGNGGAPYYTPTSGSTTGPQGGVQNSINNANIGNGALSTTNYNVRNSSSNSQNAYISAVSKTGAGVYSPDMVFGRQTSANAYAETLRIDGTIGNVGIGTTAPTAKLHLKAGTATAGTAPLKLTAGTNLTTAEAGAIEFDGTSLFYTDSGNTRRTLATAGGTFTSVTSIANSGGDITLSPTASTGSVVVDSGTSSTTPTTGALRVTGGLGVTGSINAAAAVNADILKAATSAMTPQIYGANTASGSIRIDGTSHATPGNVYMASLGGNVGIGTTAPLSYSLEIVGNGARLSKYSNDATAGPILSIKARGTAAGPVTVNTDDALLDLRAYGYDGTNPVISTRILSEVDAAPGAGVMPGRMSFFTSSAVGTSTERMRINSAGQIGIGTTAPNAPLHIFAGNTASAAINGLTIANTNVATTGTAAKITFANGSTGNVARASITGGAAGTTGGFLGLNTLQAGAMTETMRFDESGNVGIGTSTPARKLQVNGAMRLMSLASDPASAALGDIYVNSTDSTMRFHNGSSFQTLGADSFAPYTGACAVDRTLVRNASTGWDCILVATITSGNGIVKRDGAGNIEGAQLRGSSLRLENAFNYVTMNTPVGANYTLTLPPDDGNAGQVLRTDGSGGLSWNNSPTGDLMADGTVPMTGGLRLPNGTNLNPAMTFDADTNTGIYSGGADKIIFGTGGSMRASLDSAGNFGLGTASPAAKLDISGTDTSLGMNITNNASSTAQYPYIQINNYQGATAAGAPAIILKNSAGTSGSATAMASGQSLGTIEFNGVTTAGGAYRTGALIEAKSNTAFTSTNAGTDLSFYTTTNSATIPSAKLTVQNNGDILLSNGTQTIKSVSSMGITTTGATASLNLITSGTGSHIYINPSASGKIVAGNGVAATNGFARLGQCLTTAGTAIGTTWTNVACVGTPASLAYAVHCSGIAGDGTGVVVTCRGNGTADQITCQSTSGSATAAGRYCMYMMP